MLENLIHSTILIVDDEWVNVHLLDRMLKEAGYTNVHNTTDSRQALGLFLELKPDVVLLDLLMPFLDGFGLIQQIREKMDPGDYIPLLVLTADITNETRQRALSSGAKAFLTKPLGL